MHSKNLGIAFCFLLTTQPLIAQDVPTQSAVNKAKAAIKSAFPTSSYSWKWFTNGYTEFSFSLKNQSGTDVRGVHYRVIFFDRQGNQLDFEDGVCTELIPKGLAKRQLVSLTDGASVRSLAGSEKIEILSFEQVLPPDTSSPKP
jgi:hypothetical protein